MDRLWGCLGRGAVSRPRSGFEYEDSQAGLGCVDQEALGRPLGDHVNALFFYLNCRWDEGPDAWEREVGRQEVKK